MNEKGFTLVEVLAVIVLLGILAALVTPMIIKNLKKSNTKINEMYEEIIINSTKNHIKNNDKYPLNDNDKYCITFDELQKEGHLIEGIKDETTNKTINYNVWSIYVNNSTSGITFETLKLTECRKKKEI